MPTQFTSGFSLLTELASSERTPAEASALIQKAVEAARLHPADMAPLVFLTDTGEPMVPEPFHREWLDLLMDETERYLLILASRGHAKSEYIGLVYLAWYLGTYPDRRVLLVSSTDDMAMRFATRLAETFRDNDNFNRIFPNFPKVTRATQHEIRLATSPRDPALRAVGWGTTVVGARADLILIEDIATSENQGEEATLKKMKNYLSASLLPIAVPKTGRVAGIGTPQNLNDVYLDMVERMRFKEYVYPCYLDADEREPKLPRWPSRFPVEELESLKRIGIRSFTTQYLCRRVNTTGEVYTAEWFEPLVEAWPMMKSLWLCFDLAMSEKKTADYTALMLGGLGVDGDVYLGNVWRNRWAPDDTKRHFKDIYGAQKQRWGSKFRGLLSEDTKENRVVKRWFASEKETRHMAVVLDPWDNRDKYTRACDILPYCEAKRVHLLRAGWNEDFLDEVLSFTKDGTHAFDDQHDCMVVLVRKLLGLTREPRVRML